MSRPLWFEVSQKREGVGRVVVCDGFSMREIQATPARPLNSGDIAFTMLEDQLRTFGVRIWEIQEDGGVVVKLEWSDSYGRVCREIARAYFLALNSPNPRRPCT